MEKTNNICGSCAHYDEDRSKCNLRGENRGYITSACSKWEAYEKEVEEAVVTALDTVEETTPVETPEVKKIVCIDCGGEFTIDEIFKGPKGYTKLCKSCYKERRLKGLANARAKQKAAAEDNVEEIKRLEDALREARREIENLVEKYEAARMTIQAMSEQMKSKDISVSEAVEVLKANGYAGTLTRIEELNIF